jgi:TonB-linked SusC/RagA family outer membrane protein
MKKSTRRFLPRHANYFFGMFFLLLAAVASAQVTGKVVDETSQPLPGVNVVEKGTTNGATTDAEGNYKINVGAGATLIFTFVGYATQEVAVRSQTTINIQLAADVSTLSEIVVVGYGEVKKSDLTGSVAQVKAEQINAFPATNVLQALSGRAPGVQVIQNTGAPGAAVSVRVRGVNSVQGSNEPLYVIDGFPVGSGVAILNNADIESLEVLKDASATAIYGSRGANGVVLITTKRGKSGKVQVDYEGSYSVQTLRKKLSLMNAREYGEFYNLQAKNDNIAPRYTQAELDALGEGYDWQNSIFRSAPMQSHSLNVAGGNDKTRYSIGGSFLGQEGIILASNYNRYSLRANISTDVSKKFNVTYSSTLSKIQSDRRTSEGGNRGGSLIASIMANAPVVDPFNDDGTLDDYQDFTKRPLWISIGNPFFNINETKNNLTSNLILSNLALTFKPIEGLAIKISGGIESNDTRVDASTIPAITATRNQQGSASISASQFTSLLSENTVSYNKSIGNHTINAVAGFTFQDFKNTSVNGSGVGYVSSSIETGDLASATTPGLPSSSYSYAVLLSGLARVNYSFNNRYLATVSWRTDGSSRYSPGNKWGFFPSAALAWKISEEQFLKENTIISDLKVRASWGKTGSQAINPYQTLNNLVSGKTAFDNTLYTTYAPATTLPNNLKWETTEQVDVGIDASFYNDKYRLSIDLYNKNTGDLLNSVQLPTGLGYSSTIRNVGEIQNRGLEISLDARLIDKEVKWNLGGNIAFNRNKVVKLYDGRDILANPVNITLINDNLNLLREGQPMSVFFGYQADGYTDKGQVKYKDLSGANGVPDGQINQFDKTIIGNPNPNYIFGLNSSVSYKGLELTVFLQGVQGNQLVNMSAVGNKLDYGFGLNMLRDVYLSNWTPENPNAKYPIISRVNSYNYSDRLVEDGSYIRLRTIQLAYTVPLQQLGVKGLRSARFFASGQNLLTITNYSWWDPEVNSLGGANSLGQGIDWYTYPTAKTITFGLNLGF